MDKIVDPESFEITGIRCECLSCDYIIDLTFNLYNHILSVVKLSKNKKLKLELTYDID